MEKVMNVAANIAKKYKEEFGQDIDEMKLHKLMYFIQRESYIQYDEPLFDATFYGWKYGPILKEIRTAYIEKSFDAIPALPLGEKGVFLLGEVFERYAGDDSWSLSRLSHGETSWQNSRNGVQFYENSDKSMKNEDIRLDAQRMKTRREYLARLRREFKDAL